MVDKGLFGGMLFLVIFGYMTRFLGGRMEVICGDVRCWGFYA